MEAQFTQRRSSLGSSSGKRCLEYGETAFTPGHDGVTARLYVSTPISSYASCDSADVDPEVELLGHQAKCRPVGGETPCETRASRNRRITRRATHDHRPRIKQAEMLCTGGGALESFSQPHGVQHPFQPTRPVARTGLHPKDQMSSGNPSTDSALDITMA